MRLDARMICTAWAIAGCLAVAGCGKKDEGGNTVQMKNLEVVDGTTTDAMTDLDGVRSEAPAPAVPGMNASDNGTASTSSAKPAAPAENTAASRDTEVLSDQ